MRALIGMTAAAGLLFAAGSASALEVFTFSFVPPASVIDYEISATQSAVDHSQEILGVTAAATAEATRDGSEVVLRAKASLSGALTSDTDPTAPPTIVAYAGLTDTVVISSAGLDGQVGYVGFSLDYDGDLSGSVSGPGGYAAFGVSVTCPNYGSCPLGFPVVESETLALLVAPATSLSVEGTSFPGLLQFTYGTPFDYSLYIATNARVGGLAGATFDVQSDFSQTATLGKVRVYDAAGAFNPTASITSASRDFAYSVAVPEPRTWAMLLTGFALMGATLRQRPRLAAST